MTNLKTLAILALVACFLNAQAPPTADEGESIPESGAEGTEQQNEDPLADLKKAQEVLDSMDLEPSATDGSPKSVTPPPELNMDQMKQMEKMMKMMSNMTCLLGMQGFMQEKQSELSSLRGKPDAQDRLNKLISNLYGKCKQKMESGDADMGALLGGDGANYKKMFAEVPIEEILESEPELSQREEELLKEFNEAEKEMAEMKK